METAVFICKTKIVFNQNLGLVKLNYVTDTSALSVTSAINEDSFMFRLLLSPCFLTKKSAGVDPVAVDDVFHE